MYKLINIFINRSRKFTKTGGLDILSKLHPKTGWMIIHLSASKWTWGQQSVGRLWPPMSCCARNYYFITIVIVLSYKFGHFF